MANRTAHERLMTAENLIPREDLLDDLALLTPKRFGQVDDANEFRKIYLSFKRHFHPHLRVQPPMSALGWMSPKSQHWQLHIDIAAYHALPQQRQLRGLAEREPLELVNVGVLTVASLYRSEKKIFSVLSQIGRDIGNPELIPPVVEKLRARAGKEQRVVTLD